MLTTLICALGLAATQPAADAPEPVAIAVLATPHLAGAPDGFAPELLAPVLDRLEAFAPTLVLIEAPSAEHLRFLTAEADRYPGLADQFGGRARALSSAAGETMDMTPAEAEMRAADLTEDTPADLKHGAALHARAGNPAAAAALWLRLPASARTAGGPVSADLAAQLDRLTGARNETYIVGAALAARLGHGAVDGFDDWSAGDLFLSAIPELQQAMTADPALTAVMNSGYFRESARRTAAMTSAQGVLEAYRWFNDASQQAARARAEWDAFLAVRSHPEAARARLAAWEARNLRMAANIVEAAAGRPGERVLVIVGASHKPYLEDSLRRVAGVEIVESEALLAAP